MNKTEILEIEFDGSIMKAKIKGEIDHHTSKIIREDIDEKLIEFTPECLEIDFSKVTFMDSSGLGLVMGRYNKCNDAGIKLRVCNVTDRAKDIFRLSGLDRIINFDFQENIENE